VTSSAAEEKLEAKKMLQPGILTPAFQPYWDDMERCRQAKAYWSLLHVTACLPDICAALESDDGEAKRARYIDWCDRYVPNPLLSGDERYRMRCKILHQGRSSTEKPGRYTGFSFGQPSDSGYVDHMRVDVGVLHVDVGELACETVQGVMRWIEWLEKHANSREALNVETNLRSLVRVSQCPVTVRTDAVQSSTSIISKTN
jgi:hypothetical protein